MFSAVAAVVLRFTVDPLSDNRLIVVASVFTLTLVLLTDCTVNVDVLINGNELNTAFIELSKPFTVNVPGLVTDIVVAVPDLKTAMLPCMLTLPPLPAVSVTAVPVLAPANIASVLYGELLNIAFVPLAL